MAVIAILIDTYGIFQRRYVDMLAVGLKVHGYSVIAVSGRELKANERANKSTFNHTNPIYSIAKGYDVAGYIFLSGCIGHNVGRAHLDGLIQEFTSRPTVSLGVDLPSASSICSETQSGMRQLMEHLTEDGTRKNFVFIRGFKNNIDSIERENVFREVLERRGIPVQEHLILSGNYLTIDAYEALDPLVAKHPEIDVIVAANDNMAAAAIQVLKKHNLKIPTDVVVSGFDNSSLAKETSPPLTSVQQKYAEHVNAAVDTLMSMIKKPDKNQSIKPIQYFNENLIIRESSGLSVMPIKSEDLAYFGSPEEAWQHFYSEFIRDYEFILNQSNETGYDALFLSIRDQLALPPHRFNQYFVDLFNDAEYRNRDWSWWLELENLLSWLTLRVSQAGIFSPYVPLLLELQMQARNTHLSIKSNLLFDIENSAVHHARFETMLAKCQFMKDIKPVLHAYLCHHNVRRAFLVLYTAKSGAVGYRARMVYTYRIGESVEGSLDSEAYGDFDSRDILPQELNSELNTGTLVLDPLYVDEMQLGYSLIDTEGVSFLSHEYFSNALSDALNRCHDFRALVH